MTGRSNEVEVKPKINCAKKKKSDGLTDRVDFFATTVQKKKDEKLKVSIDQPISTIFYFTSMNPAL